VPAAPHSPSAPVGAGSLAAALPPVSMLLRQGRGSLYKSPRAAAPALAADLGRDAKAADPDDGDVFAAAEREKLRISGGAGGSAGVVGKGRARGGGRGGGASRGGASRGRGR
jgi:hypothetical protein